MATMASLASAPTTCRVSSVLDRNRPLYGAANMLPASAADACWSSAQGSPQQIRLQFHRPVDLRALELMFQGGFVGQAVELRVCTQENGAWTLLDDCDVSPDDSNALQRFACVADGVTALEIRFTRSTDFYGRVTVYHLDVLGHAADATL